MRVLLMGAALAAASMGCAMQSVQPVPQAEVLYRGGQCGGAQAGLSWLGDAESYHAVLSRTRAPSSGTLPEVDFADTGVVYVEMGERPTAGYGLDFLGARIEGEALVLELDWREPPEDAFTAQVITQPCLLLSMPKGDYREIRAEDSQGQERLQVKSL